MPIPPTDRQVRFPLFPVSPSKTIPCSCPAAAHTSNCSPREGGWFCPKLFCPVVLCPVL